MGTIQSLLPDPSPMKMIPFDMKYFPLFAAWAACSALTGCGENESATLKEAMAVHEDVVRLSNELHGALEQELGQVAEQVQGAFAAGDTALAKELQRFESQLSGLDMRFHEFSESMAEIPGHDHDHGHAHDHGHSHDHGDHDHDHDHAKPSLEGMSDEAILEIQRALKAGIEEIQSDLDGLKRAE